ncbi:hypothetical protein [Methylocystis heyeri]|uniref:Uncharacterized protein n=1 Tax=Methylocystis heyeri TaxID=391905 RepID=A0A6B8KJL4_9HYPH|nr:hypothetical protein [Methylocystis heyeri]QGM47719.1 hypothetical protein H2LOC_019710 [Methylocystis heyeri]
MKAKIFCGATVAAAAVGLVLAGAAPAAAKPHKTQGHHKKVDKHGCGGKNGCSAKSNGKGAAAPAPAESASETK